MIIQEKGILQMKLNEGFLGEILLLFRWSLSPMTNVCIKKKGEKKGGACGSEQRLKSWATEHTEGSCEMYLA